MWTAFAFLQEPSFPSHIGSLRSANDGSGWCFFPLAPEINCPCYGSEVVESMCIKTKSQGGVHRKQCFSQKAHQKILCAFKLNIYLHMFTNLLPQASVCIQKTFELLFFFKCLKIGGTGSSSAHRQVLIHC